MPDSSSLRSPRHLDVPLLKEDPLERKRVLNVLAQRRYRRKRKEHLSQLEKGSNREQTLHQNIENSPVLLENTAKPTFDPDMSSIIAPPQDCDSESFSQLGAIDWFTHGIVPFGDRDTEVPTCLDPITLEAHTTFLNFPLPSLPSSPSLSSSTTGSYNSNIPTVTSSMFGPTATTVRKAALSRDELHLPMTELSLLRGVVSIARRLELDHIVWDINAVSPFCSTGVVEPAMLSNVPFNLWPTATQSLIPHHPALDLLPWPAVRDKLIMVFSHPIDLRPPSARSPTAFVDFIYDLEDPAEGVRIWGDDPAAAKNWEVGEKLFDRWWWALTTDVLTHSNYLRNQRGAKLLGAPTSVAEVQ